MVVVPTGNAEPDVKPAVCVVVAPAQLSVPTGSVKVTTLEQSPGSLVPVTLPGQVIEGNWLSLMATVKLQVAVLPDASVTKKAFAVVPTGNAKPDANPVVCIVVADGQLSVPTGAAKVTTFEHWPGSLLPVTFVGQVIVGNSLSPMTTVKLHVAVLPEASVTRKVLVVTPIGKAALEARPVV